MTFKRQNPHVRDRELPRRLAEGTLALVNIPSVSRLEAEAMAHVRAELPLEPVWASDDVLFATSERRAGRPLVLLAGHVDTVPAQDNLPGRIEGDAVVGLGASDMKGGLAVMLALADWALAATPDLDLDLGFLFFTREELPAGESPVPGFLQACPEARDAELVIVLEPTDNELHVGCVGNLSAQLTFRGVSAHSARPWTGENAIHKAAVALAPLAALEPLEVEVDGLVFREVVSAVAIEGGIADNVVPDRCTARLNYRYAPGRSREAAEARLRELTGDAELEILGNSPPAHVVVDRPLVTRLREAGGFAVKPKQAWTPVAQFAEAGLDAVNLGPGATRFAHRADEQIQTGELVRTFEALRRFVSRPGTF
ncbi:MAG: succinyl-diaminopimelate desuccinylase [Actinobacteria bacterium]|nr:MAG: succinyl-diaminopimelate desuccinylase [Actinomycetota bacterium]